MGRMRVSLVRTGGVAGMRRQVSLDTATLDPARASEIERLVEAARLKSLPAANARSGQPDRFQYALTVDDGKQTQTVHFGEREASEGVRLLLDAVWRQAEEQSSGPSQA
jgi:hypothetical protein